MKPKSGALGYLWICVASGAVVGSQALAQKLEPRFETDVARIETEHAEIERLMQEARFHAFTPDAEFQAFMKTYRRGADVVEIAKLGFLTDASQPAKAFMDAASKSDAWKKPMDTPLSVIFILPFRTAQDWFRVNYVRLHDRRLDLEVDHLCPVGAPELEKQVLCVIEIPLGGLSPGPFHYTTSVNAGQYKRPPPEHPEGWEYADASRLMHGGSGCTIVDSATNAVPAVERPPVRRAEFLTEARLDQVLEILRRTKFPMETFKLFEIVGLSEEQQERPVTFGSGGGVSFLIYQLTEPPIVHLLELRGEKGDPERKAVSSAQIYYRDGDRKYTVYDSRVKPDRGLGGAVGMKSLHCSPGGFGRR